MKNLAMLYCGLWVVTMAQAQEKTACKNTQKRALFKDKSVLIHNVSMDTLYLSIVNK